MEENACGDYLAKHEADNDVMYESFAYPPIGIIILLLDDASGTSFPR